MALGVERVLIGAIRAAVDLLERTEAEDTRDDWPQVWHIGDDHCGRCFACVPVQVDQ